MFESCQSIHLTPRDRLWVVAACLGDHAWWRHACTLLYTQEIFLEPRLLNPIDEEGSWWRVVDVVGALQGREYYYCAAGEEVTLMVEDDERMCPWNNGCWKLTVGDDGLATVTLVTPHPPAVDVTLGVRALASLWAGQSSATQLKLWGLAAGEEKALVRASRVFATPKPPQCFTGF
jgi:predicted acetyltransferase